MGVEREEGEAISTSIHQQNWVRWVEAKPFSSSVSSCSHIHFFQFDELTCRRFSFAANDAHCTSYAFVSMSTDGMAYAKANSSQFQCAFRFRFVRRFAQSTNGAMGTRNAWERVAILFTFFPLRNANRIKYELHRVWWIECIWISTQFFLFSMQNQWNLISRWNSERTCTSFMHASAATEN